MVLGDLHIGHGWVSVKWYMALSYSKAPWGFPGLKVWILVISNALADTVHTASFVLHPTLEPLYS